MLFPKSVLFVAVTSAVFSMSVVAAESTEVIEVKGHTHLLRSDLDSLISSTLIEREQLDLMESSSLGETLKNTAGIHASYFGPSASSPVIRGLDGPRVKVMQNGLDGGDASRSGPDHQVTSESSTATQIEILRGPATLLYGSGAIGGVVNVIDNRIPMTQIEEFSGDISASYSSGANEKVTALVLEAGQGNMSFHFDGFWRDADETKIPGAAELEHEEHEDGEEDKDHEEQHGIIENSQGSSSGFTVGSSYINDNFTFGVAYGRIDSEYGLIGHEHEGHDHHEGHGHDHEDHHDEAEHEEGEHEVLPHIEATQNRYQAIASWQQPFAEVPKIVIKAAYTDYQLQEIEGSQVATQINNDSAELKLEIYHQWLTDWQGVLGAHYLYSDYSPIGEEAITAPTRTNSWALFATQKRQLGQVELHLGARIERVSIKPELGTEGIDVEFTPISFSSGINWQLNDRQQLLLNFSHSQRALGANEIYAFGEHLGTSSFDIGAYYGAVPHGDHVHYVLGEGDKPTTEDANTLDLGWRYQGEQHIFAASLFYSRVNNFAYQQEQDIAYHLSVYQQRQDDVTLYGGEFQHSFFINEQWTLSSFVDYSRIKLTDGGNLPRIPPLRIATQLDYEINDWHANLMVSHYTKQNKTAVNESATAGYTLVDASIYKHQQLANSELIYFVKATNLLDQEARVHGSFLKDKAPLPGASLKIGLRWSF